MRVIASVVVGAGLMLMGGAAQAVDMGELDITIRVIGSDEHDPGAITNEISLPDMPKEVVEHEKSATDSGAAETGSDDHVSLDQSDRQHEDAMDGKDDHEGTTAAREDAREEQDTSKDNVKEETEDSKDVSDEVEDSKESSTEGTPEVEKPGDTTDIPDTPESTN